MNRNDRPTCPDTLNDAPLTGPAQGQWVVRSRSLGLVLCAALALALSACGGGSGSNPSTTTDTPVSNNSVSNSSVSNNAVAPSSGSVTVDAAAPCGIANFRAEALTRINQIRAQARSCGTRGNFAAAGALAWNDALDRAATGHSVDMATRNYFSHTSPEGQTMAERVTAAGYTWTAVAENIAAGQRDIAAALAAWVASDGHCANLMGPNYQDVALSCARDANGVPNWTMNLARP